MSASPFEPPSGPDEPTPPALIWPFPLQTDRQKLWAGFIASFLVGLIAEAIIDVVRTHWMSPNSPANSDLWEMFFIPMAVGYLPGYIWRGLSEEAWTRGGLYYPLLCLPFGVAGAGLTLPGIFPGDLLPMPVMLFGVYAGRHRLTYPSSPRTPAPPALSQESGPDYVDIMPYVPPMRPEDITSAVVLGHIFSILTGFAATGLCYALGVMVGKSGGQPSGNLANVAQWTGGTLLVSNFFLIPFGMGFVATYFWRIIPDADWKRNGCMHMGLNFVLAVVGATLVLDEGLICLFMAAPIIALPMWAGFVVGRKFWKRNPFLGMSVLPLLAFTVIFDAGSPHAFVTSVTTDFHSSASPAALWRYTANCPADPHPADWFLWRMGLPMPVKSVGRATLGGRRDCDLTGGAGIGERVVVAIPNRELEFVVDRQPQNPEIVRHFILQRGRIELLPDGHGGTWLRGTSWYRLKVFPTIYFNWWASQVVHNTHRRVFAWMDELARRDESARSGSRLAGAA